MSCCLKTVAHFSDFAAVKSFLRPSYEGDPSDLAWDDASWKWEDDSDVSMLEKKNEEAWFQDCFLSLSPAGDCMAVATAERIVFLTLKWDMHETGEVKAKFATQFQSILVEDKRDEISSIICLPLASQKKTSHGNPDWTCIVVGFSSGHVKMYTENGVQLFSQIFHDAPVTKIKCQTYSPPRHTKSLEQTEELFIFYPRVVVIIDGFSLFQTLRACRNQVARATASGGDAIIPPPLAYKKWGFQDQEKVVDCESVGIITPNMFDHLQAASIIGGPNARPRNSIPVASLFLASGQYPYLAFYYAIEGNAQPFMSEVVIAVASKLKSVLFSAASGLFGLNSKPSKEDRNLHKPKIEPASPLACRYGLPDARRYGDSLSVAPNKSLAAITDTFGRVVLLDIHHGITVRMWKGYRDAQCGWIEVIEDTHYQDRDKVTPVPRIALFLVIYAPRRGLLEIWTAQQGPRIAAFNVSKWARLVCPMYALMGTNSIVATHQGQRMTQSYLIEPDGTLKSICVPFHYALGDKNSKRTQSLHLLKKIKIALKEMDTLTDSQSEDIISSLLMMKMPNIRLQAMEIIVNCVKLSAEFLQTAVLAILEQISAHGTESLDFESKLVLQCCQRLKHLVTLYCSISEINSNVSDAAKTTENSPEQSALSAVLHLTELETEDAMSLMSNQQDMTVKVRNVKFADQQQVGASKFFSCFCVFASHLKKEEGKLVIELADDITTEKIADLGSFIFHSTLINNTTLYDLQIILVNSCLHPEKLMLLLIQFWLWQSSSTFNTSQCLIDFSALVKFVTSLSDLKRVSVNSNEVSPWWQNVRSTLSQASNIPMAFSAAAVCRGIALIFEDCTAQNELKEEDANDDSNVESDTAEWEDVSMDILQWNILVKQLEDLLVLYRLLKYRQSNGSAETSPVEFSCTSVMEKGRGIVSELVAKWLIENDFDRHLLDDTSMDRAMDKTNTEKAREALHFVSPCDNLRHAQVLLNSVQKRFPFSLQHDVLVANSAWERVLQWNKYTDHIFHLQDAMRLVKLISSAVLKHGVASLIWHMYISKLFTSTALLMEKVGKVPKERLCRRDIGISDCILEKFLTCCVDILDTLMDANLTWHCDGPPTFEYEDLWQSRQGPTPLVELATSQKLTNFELLCHHFQLALTMQMMVVFSIKSVHPITLYDTKGKSAFFRDLDARPLIPAQYLDSAIISARTQFLCKVISAAVQVIPEPMPDSQQSEKVIIPATTTIDHSRTSHWMGRSMELAKMWNLDLDVLRRHHVCELYSSGLDSLAEEILPSVNDKIVLGSQLILLAGQRLYSALKEKYSTVDALARLSPNLTTWLKTLDQNTLRCLNPPLTMTAILVSNVINHMPEGHSEYQMAIALIDAVHSLMDFSGEVALKAAV